MTAVLLDGKALAQTLRAEWAEQVRQRVTAGRSRPGLAVVMIGDNPASAVYVRNKRKACEEVGFRSWLHHWPAETTQIALLELIATLNDDPAVHGILVQLPLPPQISESAIIDAIDPRKDVDAFHPDNVGRLAAGHPRFLPCTPQGVLRLLQYAQVPTAGRRVLVIGRSNIVGKPLALMLMQKPTAENPLAGDATVTVAHSRSPNLPELCRAADVLIAAVGRARLVTADMVRPGAVVVDVGMNRLGDGRLVGDVDFESVREVASAITPVPGGIGPMTIAMLLFNTLNAAQRTD